jgi:hypothetical protein
MSTHYAPWLARAMIKSRVVLPPPNGPRRPGEYSMAETDPVCAKAALRQAMDRAECAKARATVRAGMFGTRD